MLLSLYDAVCLKLWSTVTSNKKTLVLLLCLVAVVVIIIIIIKIIAIALNNDEKYCWDGSQSGSYSTKYTYTNFSPDSFKEAWIRCPCLVFLARCLFPFPFPVDCRPRIERIDIMEVGDGFFGFCRCAVIAVDKNDGTTGDRHAASDQ